MLTTSLRIDCQRKIEEALAVPERNYFVKNPTSFRLCYFVGKAIKYIIMPTPEDAARFLEKHGVIRFWCMKDDVVKMYRVKLETEIGDKCQPVQHEKMVELTWEEIDILPSQVLHYAACKEYEETGGIVGMIKRKVLGKDKNVA